MFIESFPVLENKLTFSEASFIYHEYNGLTDSGFWMPAYDFPNVGDIVNLPGYTTFIPATVTRTGISTFSATDN